MDVPVELLRAVDVWVPVPEVVRVVPWVVPLLTPVFELRVVAVPVLFTVLPSPAEYALRAPSEVVPPALYRA